jgi:predicted O-methyltransferase YrrM
VPGWLTAVEGLALYRLARGRRVLEVGSYCSRSTACLAQSALHVYAVDSFEYLSRDQPPGRGASVRERFLRTLRDYGLEARVTLVQRRFDEAALADLPGEFDLAFIDSDHGYETTVAQASLALQLLRPGSPIAFHDYGRFPGVTRAADECLPGQPRKRVDTLMVIGPVNDWVFA